MAKQQSKTMMSPKGVAVYPRLDRPDTKFDDNGIYKADIAVPLEEAEPLMEKLQEIHKAHVGKAASKNANTMWYLEEDKETGEQTGRVIFKLRAKNKLVTKGQNAGQLWDRQPKAFDAKGNRIVEMPAVGGGSVLKVFFEVYEWSASNKFGVSLQPLKVQIIDLHEFSGGDDSSPFEEEEGFTVEDEDDTFGSEETGDDAKDF